MVLTKGPHAVDDDEHREEHQKDRDHLANEVLASVLGELHGHGEEDHGDAACDEASGTHLTGFLELFLQSHRVSWRKSRGAKRPGARARIEHHARERNPLSTMQCPCDHSRMVASLVALRRAAFLRRDKGHGECVLGWH